MARIEMRSRRNLLFPRLLPCPALIILMTCCFFDETAASKNLKYEASKQEVCGNVSVKYPFWIKSDFCGLGGLQIECNSGQPLLDLIFGHYLIQRNESIHYKQQFLELKAMPDFNVSCLPDFPYPDTSPFPPSTDHDVTSLFEVLFFYHCNNTAPFPPAFPLTCSSNGINQSYVALVPWSEPHKLSWPMIEKSSCKSYFSAEVELKRGNFDTRAKTIDYKKFFNDSFTLYYWRPPWNGEKCWECQGSGCEWRQSEEEEFQCFCSDCNDPETCSRGNTPKVAAPAPVPDPVRAVFAGKNSMPLKIGLGAGIGGTLAIAMILLTMFVIRYRRMHASLKALLNNNSSVRNSLMSELAGSQVYFDVPIFQNKELKEATNNFDPSHELGHGGFGAVYYGKLWDGREVAVKRLYKHNNRLVKQFMTEVRILARLQHKNLVSLYGCTSRLSHKLLLVYEYVPNGTLADHLHGDRSEHGSLPWQIRMNIAIEAATALVYLHASDIIHRDVKTNNILLNNNFGVKVCDFGLSRLFPNNVTHISTAPQGTPGYMDPEYHQCYQLTEKSDVYSFGVVLVELVSSLPAVDITRERHEINLANLATNRIHKRAFHELIDPSLGFDSDVGIRKKITGVAELAFICLQHEKEMRPSMFTVLEELKAIASETEVVGRSRTFPPCQESDKAALLKNMNHSSPISVAQKWISSNSSCSPSMSA